MRTSISIALVLLLLAAAGIYFGANLSSKSTYVADSAGTSLMENTRAGEVIADAKPRAESVKDTDGDGIADWREAVYGTDPHRADTDGDGVPDGEEPDVLREKSGRETGGSNQAGASQNELFRRGAENDTPTDRFSKMFVSKYFELKDSKEPLDEDKKREVIEEAIRAVPNEVVETEAFDMSDLSVQKNGSMAALKAYGNALGRIVLKNSPQNLSNEYGIVIEALYNEDEKRVGDLDPILNGYAGIVDDMRRMSVPARAAEVHLKLLNRTNALKQVIEKMSRIYEEPIVGLRGLGAYPTHVEAFNDAVVAIENFFADNNVFYQQDEDGYMFNSTI